MEKSFDLGQDDNGVAWIQCLRSGCKVYGIKSYHPQDIQHRYCSGCDRFHKSTRFVDLTFVKRSGVKQ